MVALVALSCYKGRCIPRANKEIHGINGESGTHIESEPTEAFVLSE